MNKLSFKLTTGIATASLLMLSAATLAFADTGVDVSGNGALSKNDVAVKNDSSTAVKQNNNTDITNKVTTTQNTGNNSANFNTGGSVTIQTGSANSDVNINNQAGKNVADVQGGTGGTSAVGVDGNGAFSKNNVTLNNSSPVKLNQNNNTNINNNVVTKQNTGGNTASFNTGTDVVITTGDANASTNINNQASANYATVYNGQSSNDSMVNVAGNGAFSKNNVTLNDRANTYLNQNNNTDLYNNVRTYQNTGNNSASFNTGGSVDIYTGNTNLDTNINNEAGSNAAYVDNGGSFRTTYVDVSGNGAFSRNRVNVNDFANNYFRQNNNTYIDNNVRTNQNTGRNYADFNTAGYGSFGYGGIYCFSNYGYGQGDVSINTGNANSWNNLSNAAGLNVLYD